MIWWLAFEKEPFQFWLEMWIQVVLILLQLKFQSKTFLKYLAGLKIVQQHIANLLKIGVTSLKMIKNCKFVDKVSKEQSGELKFC